MIAPVTIGLIIFYFYPFFRVIRDSFHNIGAFDRDMGFVGLDNYVGMFKDKEMWQTLPIPLSMSSLSCPFPLYLP